jgi:hypothetical protein
MLVREATPEEAALAEPKAGGCERCGAGPEHDLRLVVFRGRDRYAEATVCDQCAETLLEHVIETNTG